MTISYNWLKDYLTVDIDPKALSEILTAIGLEVEHMETFESVRGGLQGLVVGKVITCEKHPGADRLKVTTVDVGEAQQLQIVCGAPNVAAGQKVVVARVGTTLYPTTGDPLTIKAAKIRNVESNGMICAADEIGLEANHEGIIVLPPEIEAGTLASDYFRTYKDVIFEIGITPNRMDAMSHLGVARDVAAYLSYHRQQDNVIRYPYPRDFRPDKVTMPVTVSIEDEKACRRYAGVVLSGIRVEPSPAWLREKLAAIGVRAINNIVDITNFILHETGQPLHAFDLAAIEGSTIIVRSGLRETFVTLDEKERKLFPEDLMICDATKPMCIAGVFGGMNSGVTDSTTAIFLESAWFDPQTIRKTSFRHGLRTDAATRFEKGIDISNTVNALRRAALLIREIAGGEIASDVVDVYPGEAAKKEVTLDFGYLKRLAGKSFPPKRVKQLFEALTFDVVRESDDILTVRVPHHKTDVSIPADLVEELLRLDGYDNVEIPAHITLSPSMGDTAGSDLREKVSGMLTGLGFSEILTNSITNSAFFSPDTLRHTVKMINSLSAELDVMRPGLIETGLQAVAYNLHRRAGDLRLFEFGKSYRVKGPNSYEEDERLMLLLSGRRSAPSWRSAGEKTDFYYAKGVAQHLLQSLGLQAREETGRQPADLPASVNLHTDGVHLGHVGEVGKAMLDRFDIRQPVFVIDLSWNRLLERVTAGKISYRDLPRQLPVERDLSMVVAKSLTYQEISEVIARMQLDRLKNVRLFDIFENEKLGAGKKSLAIRLEFLDENKTLTEKEIDAMMAKIISVLASAFDAEIRK